MQEPKVGIVSAGNALAMRQPEITASIPRMPEAVNRLWAMSEPQWLDLVHNDSRYNRIKAGSATLPRTEVSKGPRGEFLGYAYRLRVKPAVAKEIKARLMASTRWTQSGNSVDFFYNEEYAELRVVPHSGIRSTTESYYRAIIGLVDMFGHKLQVEYELKIQQPVQLRPTQRTTLREAAQAKIGREPKRRQKKPEIQHPAVDPDPVIAPLSERIATREFRKWMGPRHARPDV